MYCTLPVGDDLSRFQKNIFLIYERRFFGVLGENLVLLCKIFYLFSINFYFMLDETSFLQGIFIILPELPTKENQYFSCLIL